MSKPHLFFDGPRSISTAIPVDSDDDNLSSGNDSEAEDLKIAPRIGDESYTSSPDFNESEESDSETMESPSAATRNRGRRGCPAPYVREKPFIWKKSSQAEFPTFNKPFTGKIYEGQSVKQPIEYFRSLVSDNILFNIVNESNKYAWQTNTKEPLNLTKDELEQFFGIIFLMSIVKMPESRMYWYKNMRYDKIADVMNRKRFENIKRFLHCNDNASCPGNCEDKIYKIRPFVDALVANVKKNTPSENLSVDRQIVPFIGATDISQYKYKKSRKKGYKIFVLCGADAMIYNFEIYTGVISTCPGQPDINPSGNMVLRLLQNIPRNVGYKLFCDDWFTSMPLVTTLHTQGIYYVGTVLQKHLRGCKFPSDLELKKKGKGSSVIQTILLNGVEIRAVRWLDNQSITFLSSYAGIDPLGSVSRWDKKSKSKVEIGYPYIAKLYQKSMDGVNLLDYLLASHRSPTRSKKWYHKLVFHLLDMMVVQAWNMYRRDATLSGTNKKQLIPLLKFKFEIALCLIRENKAIGIKPSDPSADVDEMQRAKLRLGGTLTSIPPKSIRLDKVDHLPIVTERGRCRFPFCKASPVVKCLKCNSHLCLNNKSNCFKKFHES